MFSHRGRRATPLAAGSWWSPWCSFQRDRKLLAGWPLCQTFPRRCCWSWRAFVCVKEGNTVAWHDSLLILLTFFCDFNVTSTYELAGCKHPPLVQPHCLLLPLYYRLSNFLMKELTSFFIFISFSLEIVLSYVFPSSFDLKFFAEGSIKTTLKSKLSILFGAFFCTLSLGAVSCELFF